MDNISTVSSSTGTFEQESETLNSSWVAKLSEIYHVNGIALIGATLGLATTCWEDDSLAKLPNNLDTVWHLDMVGYTPQLVKLIKILAVMSMLVRSLTRLLYLVCYIFLFYAYWSGHKVVTVPWLLVSGLRCILVDLINCFTGCVVCALYGQLKPACLDFVIVKGTTLACSVFQWTIVYEYYASEEGAQQHRRVAAVESPIQDSRSADSVMAEAIVDWFIDEADRCSRFDSDTAVDEDIRKFETELSYRAKKFLEMKPEDILAAVRNRCDKMKSNSTVASATQTETIGEVQSGGLTARFGLDSELLSNELQQDARSLSEIDSIRKNPLRKFPYIVNSNEGDSEEYLKHLVGDIAVGTKSVSIQTHSGSDENLVVLTGMEEAHQNLCKELLNEIITKNSSNQTNNVLYR